MKVRTENPKLDRDVFSKALINSEDGTLSAYKKRKNSLRTQEQRLNKLEEDLAEIKSLLKKVIECR